MYLRICILCFTSLLFISGCQEKEEEALPLIEENNELIQIGNSEPEQKLNLNNEEIATHLEELAIRMPNVNSTAAIVVGPYAVVAIDVDKDLDRSRVGTVKYTVSEALKKDPYGKTAVVVADADIMERIRGMSMKVKEGHPIQGVIDEVSAIVGRYMPNFPIDDDQPKEPDQNKEIMPEDEKDQLDNIQEEQSEE